MFENPVYGEEIRKVGDSMPLPKGNPIKIETISLGEEREFEKRYYGKKDLISEIAFFFKCGKKVDKNHSAIYILGNGHVAYFDTGVKGIPDSQIDKVNTKFQSIRFPKVPAKTRQSPILRQKK